MSQSFGHVVAVLTASIVFFIIPVYILAEKQDLYIQSYVLEETAEFSEMVKNNGYLSKGMYERFLKNLQVTNQIYSIHMTHKHKVFYPVYDLNGVFTEQVRTDYINFYEQEILDNIYEKNGEYQFCQGDYFSVEVQNVSETWAERFQKVIFGRNAVNTIHITYGGLIRDENE
ncbi:hypothetical protein [Velocimicrobium porci]|uniref:Uncharacterized protein n=1 Tax=Velocimicrobium porci TaxID=2606634 RepID=A0A6L5XZN8_9FIRM|nr:hypothetical protein [Velocimicrobium porci]MSS64255.1 hypothetical protein [Velocimicrobium porci]